MFYPCKVLIVEDSPTSRFFMKKALEEAGYQVITATDGSEGLMKYVQEQPNCIILDVVLPGVSGFSVCRQLRALDADGHLPIILVSVKNTLMDHSWGLRQGADRYLPKPLSQEVLIQAVEEVLAKHL